MKYITVHFITISSLALTPLNIQAQTAKEETAILAGGCFWSMQHDFEKIPGVISTTVGYTGGSVVNPSYEQVSTGKTGHFESIKIVFNPDKISYQQILDFYWHDTDPTNAYGQFCDSGNEYHPVIFYLNETQKKIAEKSKAALLQTNKFYKIATQILPAKTFYPAEEYHQHYSDKNPKAYDTYRQGCGRDKMRDAIWGTQATEK